MRPVARHHSWLVLRSTTRAAAEQRRPRSADRAATWWAAGVEAPRRGDDVGRRRSADRSGPALTAGPAALDDRTRWAAVGSLMAAGVVGAAQIGKSAAALPALQAEYGLSLAAASWFVSVISLLGAVGARPSAGWARAWASGVRSRPGWC